MRLLQRQANGEILCSHDQSHDIPSYAILSHTWGCQEDEISFEDLAIDGGRSKPGFHKIQFCDKQANSDGLRNFWIDTCCINKASHSELSEAIVSMFQWYQNAAQCYVLMSDVPTRGDDYDQNREVRLAWESKFRNSRWFTRGWTLQELLAPRLVKFFSDSGQFLGDKRSLEHLIHQATTIPLQALRGSPLSFFTVEERLSWATHRQTTRKEDEAYCLQGIFDVFIPLIYGEGRRAFSRLQKAIQEQEDAEKSDTNDDYRHQKRLKYSVREVVLDAKDNAILKSLAFPEMHNQRLGIESRHRHSCEWILELDVFENWTSLSSGLLWIKGKPGAGKSTIMAFLHEHFQQEIKKAQETNTIQLDFFFTVRGTELQRTFLGMLRSVLNQLYSKDHGTRLELRAAFDEKLHSFGNTLQSWDWQVSELESLFIKSVLTAAQQSLVTIFVDALDEAGEDSARKIAQYFHRLNDEAQEAHSRIKICISCRHYPVVANKASYDIVVERHNGGDIAAFISDTLSLDHLNNPEEKAVWREIEEVLTESAQGVFQWASLVLRLVQRSIDDGESLEDVRQIIRQVPAGLQDVYAYILQNIIRESNRAEAFLLFQWVCLAPRPLTVSEIRFALGINDSDLPWKLNTIAQPRPLVSTDERMKVRIKALSGGLIEVSDTWNSNMLQVGHKSVSDYMLDQGLALLNALNGRSRIIEALSMTSAENDDLICKCQGRLYQLCLHYLITEDMKSPLDKTDVARLTSKNDFLDYATSYVFHHAEKAGKRRSEDPQEEIETLRRFVPSWIYLNSLLNPFTAYLGAHLIHVAAHANMDSLIARLVVDSPEVVNLKTAFGETALHFAARRGHLVIAEILIDAGTNPDAVDHSRRTALTHAASQGQMRMARWLLNQRTQDDPSNPKSAHALYAATMNKHVELVKVLIKAGAAIDAPVGLHGTALQAASEVGNEELVNILLDAGASVDVVGGIYGTALQVASRRGYSKIIRRLLGAGADVNKQAGEYGNALQAATIDGDKDIIRMLLDAGADVNAQGGVYGNALRSAAFQGKKSLVLELLAAGADAKAKGTDYGTAHEAAIQAGHKLVAAVLQEQLTITISSDSSCDGTM